MRGRRTFLIAGIIMLVAIASTGGVAVLQLLADQRADRYEDLVALQADTNQLSAMEWQAAAVGEVPLALQAGLQAKLRTIRGRLVDLEDAQEALRDFDAYRPQLEEELAELRARDHGAAARQGQRADEAFDALAVSLSSAAARNRALSEKTEHFAWIGTGVVMALSALGLAALLALLDRSGRRRVREEELRAVAFEDSLTGLSSRSHFEQQIAQALRAGRHATVAFLDLDDFKRVNDSLGHAAGDQLLRVAGERLRNALRREDVVARLGGDEFAVLALGVDDVDALVQRLFRALEDPVALEGKRLHLRASVGIADTDSGIDLLRNADLAMYAAKAAGSNRCAVFSEEMHVHAMSRLGHREELERAIEQGELVLFYQPIVDLELDRVAGFEALVRWEHPERGLLGPGEFIPLAEETGLIVPLGRWVLRTACAEAVRWAGSPYLSVNVASAQLGQPRFVEEVAGALEDSGLLAERLVLEVTESSLVGQDSAERLQELRRLGIRLAIDDFGTGYSSLSYLRRFPMDVLKIDRSFTRDVTEDPALLQAIVAMGESLGLVLVPEGIEEAAQAEALRALGCRLGQGFLFGRPAPAEAIRGQLTV